MMIQLWVSGVVSVVALAKSESGDFEYVLDADYSRVGVFKTDAIPLGG